MQQLQKL